MFRETHAGKLVGQNGAQLSEQRGDDSLRVPRGKYGPIDGVFRLERIELFLDAARHGIERLGQVLEFIAALDGHAALKIASGNVPRPFMKLAERYEVAADLNEAEKKNYPQGQQHHEQEDSFEMSYRREHVVSCFARDNGPVIRVETWLQKEVSEIGLVVFSVSGPLKLTGDGIGNDGRE